MEFVRVPFARIAPFEPERDNPDYLLMQEMIGIVGVLNPATGWRDKQGLVHIIDGKWRVLALRANDADEVPIIILDIDGEDLAKVKEIESLLNQNRRQRR